MFNGVSFDVLTLSLPGDDISETRRMNPIVTIECHGSGEPGGPVIPQDDSPRFGFLRL